MLGQELPQQPGKVNGSYSYLVNPEPLRPRTLAGIAGEKRDPYFLALGRVEQIRLGPLSSSGMGICRESPWKSSRIWTHNGSENG